MKSAGSVNVKSSSFPNLGSLYDLRYSCGRFLYDLGGELEQNSFQFCCLGMLGIILVDFLFLRIEASQRTLRSRYRVVALSRRRGWQICSGNRALPFPRDPVKGSIPSNDDEIETGSAKRIRLLRFVPVDASLRWCRGSCVREPDHRIRLCRAGHCRRSSGGSSGVSSRRRQRHHTTPLRKMSFPHDRSGLWTEKGGLGENHY